MAGNQAMPCCPMCGKVVLEKSPGQYFCDSPLCRTHIPAAHLKFREVGMVKELNTAPPDWAAMLIPA